MEHRTEKNSEQKNSSGLIATLRLSAYTFTKKDVQDLLVFFKLENTGTKTIPPEIESSKILIDGKPLQNSALIFSNGPRGVHHDALPPGKSLEICYQLGDCLKEYGDHTIGWQSEIFQATPVAVKLSKEESPWKIVARGSWATISVEREIYKKAGCDRFFAHVKIENVCPRMIGFELKTRQSVFYPVQWAESQQPQRMAISEMRINRETLTKQQESGLANLYCQTPQKSKKKQTSDAGDGRTMIKIQQQDSYDYYISFNRGRYIEIETVKSPYIVLVMDGDMHFTNGKDVQTINRSMNDSTLGEIPLKAPIKVREIPVSETPLFSD